MFYHWLIYSTRSKITISFIKQHILLLKIKRCIATKAQTHYEILGIPVDATYDEIKSAYYKLTLQYHPDKNKDESAKQMFYKISNAYDILSKYNSRKEYDKTILASGGNVNFIKKKVAHKPNAKNRAKMYNFDEWVRVHYAKAFAANLEGKQETEELKQRIWVERQELEMDKVVSKYVIAGLTIIFAGYLVYEWRNAKKHDKFNHKLQP